MGRSLEEWRKEKEEEGQRDRVGGEREREERKGQTRDRSLNFQLHLPWSESRVEWRRREGKENEN